MSTTNADDFLMWSSIPTAKFDQVGDTHIGIVVGKDVTQQRDFKTGQPKFYDDGNPMQQLVITIDTDERDPDVAHDDGKRKLYAPRSGKPQSMFVAIREAIKAAGGDFAFGGKLAVQFIGEEPPEQRGLSPRKLFVAEYRPPVTAADSLLGGPAVDHQQAYVAPAAPPVMAAAPSPAMAPTAAPVAPAQPGLI